MFYIYQITIWTIFLLLIASKIKNGNWRIGFSIVASIFLSLEIVAIYLTDQLINYRFYTHLNINAVKGHGFQLVSESVLFTVLFITLIYLFYFGSKKIQILILNRNKLFTTVILCFFILLSFPNGILSEIHDIYKILNAQEKSFKQALTDLGISPEKYITPSQLSSKKGKNIVVISIESLEQGFLGENFDNIAPNLRALSTDKAWTYYDQMPSGPGGGWTAGSLYSYQVGMPAFFKGQGNDFFQGTTDVKLTGLGHILKKAGYNSKYLIGNKDFAGISDILAAYGIEAISEKNTIGREYPEVTFGLHDFDLFQEAKLQIKNLKKNRDQPFALFISTINTHFPNGIYDKRMEEFVPKRNTNLEFTVSSIDYLINDFINHLKQEDLFDNTAIFIFPDHLLMGSAGPVVKKLKKDKRQLYLITNTTENELSKKKTSIINQIDLPGMIIKGAKIVTNAKFLVDFIENDTVIDFLNKNKIKLSSLNSASVTRKNYQNGIAVNVSHNELSITSNESEIGFLLNKDHKSEVFIISFTPDMVPIENGKSHLKTVFSLGPYDKQKKRLHLIISVKEGMIDKTYFGNKQMLGLYKKGQSIKYTKEDILLIMESNDAIWDIEGLASPIASLTNSEILMTSSEFITSKEIPSEIKVHGKDFTLTRGLNLLTIDSKGIFHLENFDTYGSGAAASDFLIRIESLIKNKRFWAMASHDAIDLNHPNFQKKLVSLGFKLLQTLSGRVAYIAYTDSRNHIKEYSSKTSLSHIIPIPSDVRVLSEDEKNLRKLKQLRNIIANLYGEDTNRFIAHAGGSIDNHKYTNSLEAMNLNYKKGFRLFELDIIKTSDNIYVAAHDWKHWATITAYKGKLPPSRKIFLEQSIYKRYSPLDMEAINAWFNEHSDAVLVTDKVNTPLDFSNHFVDKKRLMMELFTWEAVKKGIHAKIRSSMPSGEILKKITGNKISFLKKLGVTAVAYSRRSIDTQKKLITDIVNSGINIFAFHLHSDEGKDEMYVVCHEQEYFYGMYADKWDFNATIDCSKH